MHDGRPDHVRNAMFCIISSGPVLRRHLARFYAAVDTMTEWKGKTGRMGSGVKIYPEISTASFNFLTLLPFFGCRQKLKIRFPVRLPLETYERHWHPGYLPCI